MSVTPEEVRRIAALARLRPDDEAVARLAGELNGILQHIRMLEEVDVSGVDERERITEGPIEPRDPALSPDPLDGGAPESIAPDWREGFFVVPRLPGVEE